MEENQLLKNGDGTERKRESAPSENPTASKRQRKPSVRLGDQQQQRHCDSNLGKDSNLAGKYLKSKALINNNSISKSGCVGDFRETLDDDENGNLDGPAGVIIGSWKGKDWKPKPNTKPKGVKTNWGLLNGDNGNDFSRDFDLESSESPVKQQSPNDDNLDRGFSNDRDRKQIRDDVGVSVPLSKGANDWKCGKSNDRNVSNGQEKRRRCDNYLDDGVRIWLSGLGLGRYAPVFEIHEVDYEVLPLLTLEDLKDMGVNSVGSRRKMYSAIQKLG